MNWLPPLIVLGLLWSISKDLRAGQSNLVAFYTADKSGAPFLFWSTIIGQSVVAAALALLWINYLISN